MLYSGVKGGFLSSMYPLVKLSKECKICQFLLKKKMHLKNLKKSLTIVLKYRNPQELQEHKDLQELKTHLSINSCKERDKNL